MIALSLIVLVTTIGYRAGYAKVTPRWERALVLHLALIIALTLLIQSAGSFLGSAAICFLSGAWLVLIVVVHAGHTGAIANYGSALNCRTVIFAVKNLGRLARTFPRQAVQAVVALIVTFLFGAFLSWGDSRAETSVPDLLGLAGSLLASLGLIAALALVVWWHRIGKAWDPLLAIVFGSWWGNFPVPPYEPSLSDPAARAAAPRPARQRTVVLFVVDSLRARNLPFHGYDRPTAPFLTSLVTDSGARAVPVALSPCPSSETAIWSLLTSRRYRDLAINAVGLHHVLHQSGYKLHFLLSGIHRAWMGLDYLYGTGHELFLEDVADADLLTAVSKLPPKVHGSGGDFFEFYLMAAHTAGGRPEPQHERWLPAINRLAHVRDTELAPAVRSAVVNYYDNSVLQADDNIRRICGLLDARGYLRDAVIVVTADHGEGLGERSGDYQGHGRSLFQESIHIPLLVWDTTASLPETALLADLTDVAPTVADLLGIAPPSSWQGQSIFREPFRLDAIVELKTHPGVLPKEKQRTMEAVLSLFDSGLYKMVTHRDREGETLRALFCLSTDPGEELPLEDAALQARLEARRAALLHATEGRLRGRPQSRLLNAATRPEKHSCP
jgi:glucan phosphoethanolaminetransferase (alkaline phosphatase superfamily)